MKKTSLNPVEQEYATKLTLTGIFITFFAAFITRISGWGRQEKKLNLSPYDLVMLSFASLRLGRLISYDRVAEPLREPFAVTVPDPTGAGDTVEPRGQGAQNSIGQLITCPICAGTWVAAALVYGLQLIPNATRLFMGIMATMGISEVLQALIEAFQWTGQLARVLAGKEMQARQVGPLDQLFKTGGNIYVGHDHEEYYHQG